MAADSFEGQNVGDREHGRADRHETTRGDLTRFEDEIEGFRARLES